MIFEIISPSTARLDRTTKLLEYRSIPSVRRYVLLEQDAPALTIYTRTEAGWIVDVLTGTSVLTLPEIAIELPIDELYLEVVFPPEEAGER